MASICSPTAVRLAARRGSRPAQCRLNSSIPRHSAQRLSTLASPTRTYITRTAATLTDKVSEGLCDFFPESSVDRVKESIEFLCADKEFSHEWEGGKQVATSYIAGLTAAPWHEPDSDAMDLKWWLYLEKNWKTIKDEFLSVVGDEDKLAKGESIWVPAVDKNALAYGNEWRTLVLQDRGRWEPTNTKLFPKTTEIMKKSKAPSLEVFFARQPAGTGIKPHTDNSNFIMTGHLALVVPEGSTVENLWIKSGNEARTWVEGKSLVMDTSFIHSTANDTEGDRYVLIVRFWHPEVTRMEKLGMQFVFDAIDEQDVKTAKKNLQKAYKRMGMRMRI